MDAIKLRNTRQDYYRENPVKQRRNFKTYTLRPCSTDSACVVYGGKILHRIAKREDKYIKNICPFYPRDFFSHEMKMEWNEDQKKKFTYDMGEYKDGKAAFMTITSSWVIIPRNLVIVEAHVLSTTPWIYIYIFLNKSGNILRYYKFDFCQKREYKM